MFGYLQPARADGVFIDQVVPAAQHVPNAAQRRASVGADTLTTGSLAGSAAAPSTGGSPANVNLFVPLSPDLQLQIFQDGFGSRLAGSSTGTQSAITVTQSGWDETLSILQDGQRNSLVASQAGRGQTLSITQVGNGQMLTATQDGLNNVMALQQSGTANVMALAQSGTANVLNAAQTGTGNRLVGYQR